MTGRAYGLIALGNATLTGVLSGWLLYFYLPPTGQPLVPVALYGMVLLLSRVGYVLCSFPMEAIARRTHTPWGQRLPYVVGGALCMPFLFMLLWTPAHGGGSGANLAYLTLVLIGFNLASVAQQIPYDGLLPELAPGEKERGGASNWRMGFLLGGNILAGFAGPLIEKFGYVQAMWIFAGISGVCLILPGLWLSRRVKPEARASAGMLPAAGVRAGWNKPAFRVFALTWGLMWLATTFSFEGLPYIVTEICRASKADTAYVYFAALGAALLAYPAVNWLAERFGARAVFRSSLLAGALVTPGLMLIGDAIPLPLLAQGMVWMGLQAACLAGAQSLPGAITAEIDDTDYSAAGNLIDQIASGAALAIIPLLLMLGRSQSDPQGPLGVRLLGLAGGAFLLGAFVVFGRFKVEHK